VITRRDSGKDGISFSGILGTGLGIALSNAYYPPQSVSMGEVESRLGDQFCQFRAGNLLPEFWPTCGEIRALQTHPRRILPRSPARAIAGHKSRKRISIVIRTATGLSAFNAG